MPPICRFAGILLFLAATLSRAAIPDPLPDQPGALTPADIQAVTAMMKSTLGSGPELPLVASGKRLPGMAVERYALFATPFVDYSPRAKRRTRLLCLYSSGWRCPHILDEFQMTANGIGHLFAVSSLQGTPDRQTALDVIDFMYSPCFVSQFAALGGTPFTPSPDTDYVRSVFDDGKGLGVGTGPYSDNNSYRLQKTDKSADGCGFRIENARFASTGQVLPENYAKEMAQARALAWKVARSLPGVERADLGSDFGFLGMWGAAILGGLALFVPRLTRAYGRWTRAFTAGAVAVACTVTITVSLSNIHYSPMPFHFFVYIPAFLASWLMFVGLAIWAALGAWKNRS